MPHRKPPTYTPPPPRPWAEVREIVLQRAEARERRDRGLNHALTTASWLHRLAVVLLFASLIPLALGDVWWAYTLTVCSLSTLNAALLAIWIRRH